MRRSLAGRCHGRTDRRDRRRRLTLEGLEDRRLLAWTFSISGSVAGAVSDGSSDRLYIVQSGGNLYHSVDGTSFSPDWSGNNSGTTLAASSTSTINIDPTSGSNDHTILLGDYRLSPAITNQAQINIINGGSNVALTIDDSTDTSSASGPDAYTIDNGAISTPLGINVLASGGALGGGITLEGGTQADTYNLSGSRAGEGVTLTGGNGGNSFNVTRSSSPTTINVGGGTNLVSLGGTAGAGTQLLTGATTLAGSGWTVIAIDDLLGTSSPQAIDLDATQITGSAPGTIDYSGLSQISTLAIGTTNFGGATLDVTGAPVTSSTVRLVAGSGGTNTFRIGDASHALSGFPSDQFQIVSTGSAIDLTIDDEANSSAATVAVAASTLSLGVSQRPQINYAGGNLASLTFDGGSGGNTINVTGTPASITTTINSGSGIDNVDVLATGSGGMLTIDTQGGTSANEVTLGGVADTGAQDLLGTINIASTGGSADLAIDDSQDAADHANVQLSGSQLSGLTPSAIDLSDLSDLTIDAGAGTDSVVISGTPTGATVTLSMSSSTTNALGLGTPSAAASTLGSMTINGTFGLTIDDSADATGGMLSFQGAGISFGPAQLPTFGYFGDYIESLTILAPATAAETVDIPFSPYLPMGTQILVEMGSSTSNAVQIGVAGLGASRLNGVTVTGTTSLTIDDTNSTGAHPATITSSSLGLGPSTPTFIYSGATLSGLTVVANSAGSTVDVTSSPVGTGGPATLTLNLPSSPAGTVNLGNDTNAAAALGNVTITGLAALVIDDTADATTSASVTVSGSSVSIGNTMADFNYSGAVLSSLTFDAGTAGTSVTVAGSPPGLSTTLSPLILNMGTAQGNGVNLGGGVADALGNVTINGDLGLIVDDSASGTGGWTIAVTATTIDFSNGISSCTFDAGGATLSSLTVAGGPGGNVFLVAGTPEAITTDLRSGTRIDVVQVQATGAGGTLNLDSQGGNSADFVTLGGAAGAGAQDLLGTINVQSTGGFAVLDVNDALDTNVRSATLGSAGLAEATLTGIAPATIRVSLDAVGNMGIETGTAPNPLTVDCTAGDPLPAILRFSGQGSNTLDLRGAGAGFTSERYLATGPGAGSLSFDGAHQIVFSQLTPINDTVPVSTYHFSAPGGSTALNIVDGPTVDGFATTQIASPTGAFELINFANKASATATASDAATTIGLDNPNPAAGLQSLTIVGGSGGNTVNVTAAPAGVSTAINLGGGNDQAVVSSDALPAGGTLNVDGGPGTNDLTAGAPTTTASAAIAGTVGFGTGTSFGYQNIQTLEIFPINQPPAFGAVGSLASTPGRAMSDAVVARFTDADTLETASSYAATISWGDGTASTGTIVPDATTPGLFEVIGSHTYQAAGTFAIEVSLADRGGTFASAADATAVTTTLVALGGPIDGQGAGVAIQASPIVPVSGGLTPGSVTGPLGPNGFVITRINMPKFSGSASPGATVQIFATGTSAGAPDILIATATADSAGLWSASDTTQPLLDGPVMFHATAGPGILPAGALASAAPTMISLGGAIVDTRGPVVTGMAFDRLRGRLTLTFQDGLSGLDRATLSNLGNYRIAARPISARIHVPRSLVATHVVLSQPASPTDPVTAALTINQGRPLRGGRYFFRVSGLGVRDLAGNGLNGTFNDSFPTGGGLHSAAHSSTGSDFLAEVTTFCRKTLRPAPVNPSAIATRPGIFHGSSAQPHATPIAPAAARLHDAALVALAMSERHGRRRR
jgi:hypothetical protein